MKFNYQARTKSGEIQVGTVEAASREGALILLQRHGLFITSLEEAESVPFYTKKLELSRVSQKDLVMFSRSLSIMFKSKVPLVESLRTLAEQSTKVTFREKIFAISEKVEGGTSFSEALSNYPKLFSLFYVNMVKAGEASGKLSESLDYLADHLEREYNTGSKLKGAMMYPIMIIVMMVGIIFMMAFYVLPQLTTMLEETGQELPFITRMIIKSTNLIRSWVGMAMMAGLGVAFVFLFRFSKTPKGKDRRDKFLLKVPVVGSFLKMVYVSRFAENLSTLISGGLPIANALEISAAVVGNSLYQKIIIEATNDVRKGENISSSLKKYPEFFPKMFTAMVMVGEKTGTLDTTLLNVVVFYRAETERSLENLLRLIEPLLIMILGGGVGVLVASILLPLYNSITTI